MTHKGRKATYHGAYVRVTELGGSGHIVEQYNFLAGNWIAITAPLDSAHDAYLFAMDFAANLLLKAINNDH